VNGVVPVLAAGGTFAMATLAGLALGAWVAARTGQGLWVVAGLFGGLIVGGYSAYRLLMRSL
jgi:uncharacterized protein YneF (UPF0154 family)